MDARKFYDECVHDHCKNQDQPIDGAPQPGDEPAPQPGNQPEYQPGALTPCLIECNHASLEALQSCLQSGTSATECHELATAIFMSCLEEDCQKPDGPGGCHPFCEMIGDETHDQCMASGNDNETCGAVWQDVYETCMEETCDEPGPESQPEFDSTTLSYCVQGCGAQVHDTMMSCIEQGLSEGQCEVLVSEMELFENCLKDSCGKPDDLGACDEFCEMIGDENYDLCTDVDESQETCNAIWQEHYEIDHVVRRPDVQGPRSRHWMEAKEPACHPLGQLGRMKHNDLSYSPPP